MRISEFQPSMTLTQANNEISMKVLDKQLETQEILGADMAKMMEMSVNPNIGANFDITV